MKPTKSKFTILEYMVGPELPYERYLIYLSADVFGGIKVRMFKPYVDYKFTLHKYGFYNQISAGANISFYNDRITLVLADIIKFYRPDIKNYIHLNIGFTITKGSENATDNPNTKKQKKDRNPPETPPEQSE